MKQGTAEIKGHAWYDGFSWEACAARETRGPFPVQMASEEDTSAFDDYTGATGYNQVCALVLKRLFCWQAHSCPKANR